MTKAEKCTKRWSAEQYLRSGGRYIAAGFCAWFTGAVIGSTMPFFASKLEGSYAPLFLTAIVLLIPIMLLLFWFGFRRKYLGEQLKAAATLPSLEDLGNEREPIVLYLRPFGVDGSRATFGDFQETVEQKMVKRLGHLGKVVCIGRPEEDLPHLGAVRLYISDDKWRGVVSSLMKNSRLVVLAWNRDNGDGLQWEFQEALRVVDPRRLLLFLPFQLSKINRVGAYNALKKYAGVFGVHLPEYHGQTLFVVFGEKWVAQPMYPKLTPYEEAWCDLGDARLRRALITSLRHIAPNLEFEEPWERELYEQRVAVPVRIAGRLRKRLL